jgi:hypothetical protein
LSDAVKVQLILSGTSLLIAIITAYFARQAAVTSRKTEQNTNHMKDELVASVREAAYEAGRLKGGEDRKE